jgi:hypothetical protein
MPEAIDAPAAVASCAVMMFVAPVGIGFDLHSSWKAERERFIAADRPPGTPSSYESLAGTRRAEHADTHRATAASVAAALPDRRTRRYA